MSTFANNPSPAPGISDGLTSTISGCGLVSRSLGGGFGSPTSPRTAGAVWTAATVSSELRAAQPTMPSQAHANATLATHLRISVTIAHPCFGHNYLILLEFYTETRNR
jgi:hypothetical protein